MQLADLIDLEWLLRDGADPNEPLLAAARPAAARACEARGTGPAAARGRLDADRELRLGLARAVLEAARERDDGLPGRRIEHAFGLVALVLIGLGLLVGASTALAVLAYDGTTPVNVLHFGFVFFALQILLLGLLLWFLLRSRRNATSAGPGVLHRPVAWLLDRLLGKRGRPAAELLRALRTRRSLYGDLERWTLFALAQRFGVAFNAGALAVTLLLVTGTDLVFSWSTTLDLTPPDVHHAVRWLALPWSFWPDGVPTLATVEASQWMRMPRAFVVSRPLAGAQPLPAQWWRFLVAGLVAYGLVPRLLALAFGSWRRAHALRSVGLDDARFQRLFDRLLPPSTGWVSPDPALVRGEPPRAGGARAAEHAPSEPGASAVVLCWGSLAAHAATIRAAATRRFSVAVRATLPAGAADLETDAAALRALAADRPQRAIVALRAGHQPTADVLGFLRSARAALGASRPLIVLLAEPDGDGGVRDAGPEETAIWRRSLAGVGDPHLWTERLVEER